MLQMPELLSLTIIHSLSIVVAASIILGTYSPAPAAAAAACTTQEAPFLGVVGVSHVDAVLLPLLCVQSVFAV